MLHACKEGEQIKEFTIEETPKLQGKTRSRSRVLLGAVVIVVLVAISLIFIDTSTKNVRKTESIPITEAKPAFWRRFLPQHGDKLAALSLIPPIVWSFLRENQPAPQRRQRKQRKHTQEINRIEEAINYRWKGTLHWVPEDGNYMVHAFCMYLKGTTSAECALQQRNEVVDRTLNDPENFPADVCFAGDDSEDAFEDYRTNGEWLENWHVKAWHLKNRINVVSFRAYPNNRNRIGVVKHWNPKWEERAPCGIMHHNGNHYWYVQLPGSDQLKQLPYFDADNDLYTHIDIAQSITESALEIKQ